MIKSDNWIRQMCESPTHAFVKQNGVVDLISEPFSPHQKRTFDATIARNALLSCTILDEVDREEKELFTPLIESVVELPVNHEHRYRLPMIEPFLPTSVKHCERGHRVISSGVSSYGYDVRLSDKLRIFTNINSSIIDPYELDENCYVDAEIRTDEKGHKYAVLPPNSFLLGHTIEYFRIPNDVIVVAVGKSTWARAGVGVTITPIEPGFEGQVVIEVANFTNLPVKIYVEVGISQFLFFQSDERCNVSYSDRSGKYQGQTGIVMPKV